MSLTISRLFSAGIAIFLILGVSTFPRFYAYLGAALLIYGILLRRFSQCWLLVLPSLLVAVDLTPWTGRILVNEFDFFVLITVALALGMGRVSYRFIQQPKVATALTVLLVAQLIAISRGVAFFLEEGEGEFFLYHSLENVLRVSKGFWEALFLLPLLEYERSKNQDWGKYFFYGMLLSGVVFILIVFWERLAFPGLFDVRTDYRITGLFSGMLLGGAMVDGYLAMVFPFFWFCFRRNNPVIFQWIGSILLVGGLYCVLVTYTRSTYLAVLLGFISLIYVSKDSQFFFIKSLFLKVLPIGVGILIILSFLGGDFVKSRFSTVGEDLLKRVNHWEHALHLMGESPINYILGAGLGTYPKLYFEESNESSFILKQGSQEEGFIRLIPNQRSGELYIRQRFLMEESNNYTVSVKVRTQQESTERLLIELCERNILPFLHECPTVILVIPPTKGAWVELEKDINLSGYHSLMVNSLRPTEISIMNRGLHQHVDITEIKILGSSQTSLLKNTDFSNGFDYWFYSSGTHLAWHVKNQLLAVFFEGGIVGLFAFGYVLSILIRQCSDMLLKRNVYAIIFSSSLVAMAIVCLFDSPLDDPRISWLFYLFAFVILFEPVDQFEGFKFSYSLKQIRLVGVLFLLAIPVSIGYLMKKYDVDFKHLVLKGKERLVPESSLLDVWLRPEPKFQNWVMDGIIRQF